VDEGESRRDAADMQNCAASLGQNKVVETLFFKVS
jgi:hypothetical protein